MSEHITESYISALSGNAQNDAASFVEFLLEGGLQLERGRGITENLSVLFCWVI
jgi:hypothetical protein